MGKKVLHIVFVLVLVLVVPFSSLSRPVVSKAAVKAENCSANKKEKEATRQIVQPQVVHVQVSHAHALLPCLVDHPRYEIIFPQQEVSSPVIVTLLDKGSSKFFKTLFRHVIATQAP